MNRSTRFNVFKRDNFTCQYCGVVAPLAKLEVDHIQSRKVGGKDHISNYITACFDCNRGKRGTPLLESLTGYINGVPIEEVLGVMSEEMGLTVKELLAMSLVRMIADGKLGNGRKAAEALDYAMKTLNAI